MTAIMMKLDCSDGCIILKTSELSTLKRRSLWYVNYISIELLSLKNNNNKDFGFEKEGGTPDCLRLAR